MANVEHDFVIAIFDSLQEKSELVYALFSNSLFNN